MHKELSSSHKPHNKEYFLLCLENVVHSNKEGMVSLQQYIFFQLGAFNLIVINDDILSQRFHSIHLLGTLFLYQKDLTEASSTNNF